MNIQLGITKHKQTNLFKVLLYLLGCIPIVDTINGMLIKGYNISGVGQLFRLVILALIIFRMIISHPTKRHVIIIVNFVVFCIFQFIIEPRYGTSSVELTVKLFTPILMIYVFSDYKKKGMLNPKKIDSLFDWLSIVFPLTIILPFVLKLGYSTYRNDVGYKAFYFATNEISFATVTMIMYTWQRLREKTNAKYLLRFALNGLSCLLLGSKIAIGIFALFVVLFGFGSIFTKRKGNMVRKLFLAFAMLIIVIIATRLLSTQINNIVNRWLYNSSNAESRLAFLTSHRNVFLQNGWTLFSKSGFKTILFGWGFGGVNNGMINTEMDFFDLLFCTGVFGAINIIAVYSVILKDIMLKNKTSFLFVGISLGLSFVGGHVLFTGLGGMLFALLIVYASLIEKKNMMKK